MSDVAVAYGPSLTELDELVASEKLKRRKIRILQVRAQARQNAKRIRHKYAAKKENLICRVANVIQMSMDKKDEELFVKGNSELSIAVQSAGNSHVLASLWRDPRLYNEEKMRVAQRCAAERNRIASQNLRLAQQQKREDDSEPRARLIAVREIEKQRALLVAALPKRATEEKPIVSDSKPTVVIYDTEAKMAGQLQTAPCPAQVSVPNPLDLELPATIAAENESARLENTHLMESTKMEANRMKADFRGQQALKRERIRRHYEALITRLEECGRGDVVRRRAEYHIICTSQQEEQRQAKKDSKQERLSDFAKDTCVTKSLPDLTSLEQTVRFELPYENEEDRAVNSPPQTTAQRQILGSRENQIEDVKKSASSPMPKYGSEHAKRVCRESKRSESNAHKNETQKLEIGDTNAREHSPKLTDEPLTIVKPSVESTLGPGERPKMDSVRLLYPAPADQNNNIPASDILRGPNVESFDNQSVIDDELADIDARLARIKLAVAMDLNTVPVWESEQMKNDDYATKIDVTESAKDTVEHDVKAPRGLAAAQTKHSHPRVRQLTHLSPVHQQQFIKLVQAQLESGFVSSRSSEDQSSSSTLSVTSSGLSVEAKTSSPNVEYKITDSSELLTDYPTASSDSTFTERSSLFTPTVVSPEPMERVTPDVDKPKIAIEQETKRPFENAAPELGKPNAPRMSLIAVEEETKTRIINSLASRLSESALRNAQAELQLSAQQSENPTAVQSDPHVSSSPSPISLQPAPDSLAFTPDSLQAELRALLTSSLISTLTGGSSLGTSGLDLSSSMSQLIRRLLDSCSEHGSGPSFLNNRRADELFCALQEPSRTPTSPSTLSGVRETDGTADAPANNGAQSLPATVSDTERKQHVNDSTAKLLTNYIKVNKDWILSLAGRESLPSSSSTSGSPTSSNASTVFRSLSPADGQSDTSTIEHTSEQQLTDSSTTVLSKPPCKLPSGTLTSFKPLPPLDEAACEESMMNLSDITVDDLMQPNKDSLNTPSSWTDSRRSSGFMTLSHCSTSNSNQRSSTEDTQTSEPTTLHQLRSNVPPTPYEPCEAAVVSFLGSNMSSSTNSRNLESLVQELLQTSETDFVYHNLPPIVRLTQEPPKALPTRTTTTIDSAWDDADGSSRNVEDTSSNTMKPLSTVLNGTMTSDVPDKENTMPPSPNKDARPSTPAEGAISARCPSARRNSDALHRSMPTIFIQSDSHDESTEIFRPRKGIPVAGRRQDPLVASWSNYLLRDVGPETSGSLSDSLRSFQEHEHRFMQLNNNPPLQNSGIAKNEEHRPVKRPVNTLSRATWNKRDNSKVAASRDRQRPARSTTKTATTTTSRPQESTTSKLKSASRSTSSSVKQKKIPRSVTTSIRSPRCATNERNAACSSSSLAKPSVEVSGSSGSVGSVEQSLLQHLNQWRASRLSGIRGQDERSTPSTSRRAEFSFTQPISLRERSAMEELSSEMLLDGVVYNSALTHRPSSPTPREMGRLFTSSEETTTPANLQHISVSFDLFSAACAGDEAQLGRHAREPRQQELRFSDQPQSIVLSTDRRPNPGSSNAQEVASVRTATSNSSRPQEVNNQESVRRSVDTRHVRNEQARQNRLRVKEFDRLRRQQLLRRSQNRRSEQ